MSDKQSEFFSRFSMGEEVEFMPRMIQAKQMGIAEEPLDGTIVAVKFTEAKVFYTLINNYWGKMFEDVPSEKIRKIEIMNKPESI